MFGTYPGKREEVYNEHLQNIAGIKFTFREVDIIACILHNRGEKKSVLYYLFLIELLVPTFAM